MEYRIFRIKSVCTQLCINIFGMHWKLCTALSLAVCIEKKIWKKNEGKWNKQKLLKQTNKSMILTTKKTQVTSFMNKLPAMGYHNLIKMVWTMHHIEMSITREKNCSFENDHFLRMLLCRIVMSIGDISTKCHFSSDDNILAKWQSRQRIRNWIINKAWIKEIGER